MTVLAWQQAQKVEREWWSDCANTHGEETKQLIYADRMGLTFTDSGGPGPVCDLGGRSVVDLGGGPVSLLLKCSGFSRAAVVDPCRFPNWVARRYKAHGVTYYREPAEHFVPTRPFDEVWIYNVLQHVRDPELVIATARQCAQQLRLFEWLEVPADPGHPHVLTASDLHAWIFIPGAGFEQMDEGGATGLACYGVFPLT